MKMNASMTRYHMAIKPIARIFTNSNSFFLIFISYLIVYV